jgi:hypothetical protein
LDKRGNAVVPWFAIDVAPIVGIDVKRNEGFACCGSALLKKTIEQPFPSRGVQARRLGQYAVEIEQDRVVITGGKRNDGSYTSHAIL